MATRTPKIPARSTLLNSSLDGMDDLFDFKTKTGRKQAGGREKETGSAQPLCLEKQGRILNRRKRIAGNIKHT